jgi:polar amino acid transport system substrate-binding protein
MKTLRLRVIIAVIASLALLGAACSEEPAPAGGGPSSTSPSAEPDLLATIKTQGFIRVATDQKYKPQSWYDAKAGEWKGFDVEVAREIADRLGVEAKIEHRGWEVITAGSWNDRWDVSVGSMTITVDREELFSFTPAYYYTPASIAVHTDNTSVQDLSTDLDGKRICVGVDTTYESYLAGDLDLGPAAPPFDFVVDNPKTLTFETDTDALDQLALGDGVRCDAAMTATPTTLQYIKDGGPVKIVGEPLYNEPLAIAFDKESPIDNASLVDAVSQIVEDMHADGTLTQLSMKWYGEDITQAAAA